MLTQKRQESGQALLELALVLPMMLIFVLGIVDFSRAIYDREVITNLAGEGSSLASRGTSLPNAIAAVEVDTGSDISLSTLGCVIISSVGTGGKTGYQVTGQATSAVCNGGVSKVGCYPVSPSCTTTAATVPAGVRTLLTASPSTTVFVTEVFYKYTAATPIGSFLNNSNLFPTDLYSAAYY